MPNPKLKKKKSSKSQPVPTPRRRSSKNCPPCPPCPEIPAAPRSSRSRSRSGAPPGGVAVFNLSQITNGIKLKKRSKGSTKKKPSKGSISGAHALAVAAANKRSKLKKTPGQKLW